MLNSLFSTNFLYLDITAYCWLLDVIYNVNISLKNSLYAAVEFREDSLMMSHRAESKICPALSRLKSEYRARICKRLRSPRIGSKESILPAYDA